MRHRSVLLCALAAIAVAVPSATAAAPVCQLVKDKADDASINPAISGVLKYKALDIKSFDVATGKKTLVAVLRLTSAKHADEAHTSLNALWKVDFKIAGVQHSFSRKVENGTVTDTAKAGDNAVNGVKVAVGADTITWTVPRGSLSKLKKGSVIDGLYAGSSGGGAYDQAPDGGYASGSRYVDGKPSCVRPA